MPLDPSGFNKPTPEELKKIVHEVNQEQLKKFQEWCKHDYKNPKRFGRADWRCSLCGKNIMLELVLIQDALVKESGLKTEIEYDG